MISGRFAFQGLSEYLTWQKIKQLDYTFPEGFDEQAKDLIQKLLVRHIYVWTRQCLSRTIAGAQSSGAVRGWGCRYCLRHASPPLSPIFCLDTLEDAVVGYSTSARGWARQEGPVLSFESRATLGRHGRCLGRSSWQRGTISRRNQLGFGWGRAETD
jgi:hypothetical protein